MAGDGVGENAVEWGPTRNRLFLVGSSYLMHPPFPFLLNHPRVVPGPRGNLRRAQIGDLEPSMSLAPVPDRFLSLRQKLLRVSMQLGIPVDCPKWGTVAELFNSRHGTHYQIQYNHSSFWYKVSSYQSSSLVACIMLNLFTDLQRRVSLIMLKSTPFEALLVA